MNEQHWQIAEAIAQTFRQQEKGVNELKKLVSYLRWWQTHQQKDERNRLGDHLGEYLHRLIANGEIRSQQTQKYYQTLEKIYQDNLELFSTDTETAIQILGWASRLSVYYNHDPQPAEALIKDKHGNKTSIAAAFERAKRPQ